MRGQRWELNVSWLCNQLSFRGDPKELPRFAILQKSQLSGVTTRRESYQNHKWPSLGDVLLFL